MKRENEEKGSWDELPKLTFGHGKAGWTFQATDALVS